MPIIQSAIKQLRQDKKRTIQNKAVKRAYKDAMKQAVEKGTKKLTQNAYSIIDKAAKKNVIHKNKAARLKHQVASHAKN